MSISHIIIVALVMIIVIPPEKLPEVMRNIARLFNDLRRSTSGVWDDIKREAAVRPEDLFKHTQKDSVQQANANLNIEPVSGAQAVQNQSQEIPSKVDSSDGSKS